MWEEGYPGHKSPERDGSGIEMYQSDGDLLVDEVGIVEAWIQIDPEHRVSLGEMR
jgi:hypothetical protein